MLPDVVASVTHEGGPAPSTPVGIRREHDGPGAAAAPPQSNRSRSPAVQAAAIDVYNEAKHEPHYYTWQVEGNYNAWHDLEKDVAKRFEDGVTGIGDPVFQVYCPGNNTNYIYNCREKWQLNVTSGKHRLVRRLLIAKKDVIENFIVVSNLNRLNATRNSGSSRSP